MSEAEWKPIETAPQNGDEARVGIKTSLSPNVLSYSHRSHFLNGKWCVKFGDRWRPYAQQPTHYLPAL